MEANIVDLRTLYEKPISYRIPQFQRAYAWKQETQWDPLWDDVEDLANRVLADSDATQDKPHFMGAIVLYPQSNNTGEVEKRLVVDGQQRLTTLQLLIKAGEAEFRVRNDNDRAGRFARLTANPENQLSGDEDNDTKIRQSNRNDQTAFQHVVRDFTGDTSLAVSDISDGYQFFRGKISRWLDGNPVDQSRRSDALESAITSGLKVAAIDLDDTQEPHVIFETLNERGEPLSQSDRVKNTIMYKADVVDDASKARDLWGVFEDTWWRNEAREGRLIRTHNDRFLNYWVVMKTRSDVSSDKIAKEFRRNLDTYTDLDISSVANEIKNSGLYYRQMEDESQPHGERVQIISTLLQRMKILEFGVITPLLLWFDSERVSDAKLTRATRALESFLVRRSLCGYQSQGLNRYFIDLLTDLDREGHNRADAVVIDRLKGGTSDAQVWPSDRLVHEALTTQGLRGNVRRRTMVLLAIEESLRSDKAETIGDTKNFTLEHIMPQQWETHWPLSGGMQEGIDQKERRDNAVKEIGNLTLVTQKLNSGLSNGPWEDKRKALHEHSSLFLNKTLLDAAPEKWVENTIRERSNMLADRVLRIWPHADSI